eukprot:TRINITY_DN53981_c0_g2_i1.p1 TRINITY_DN53981_c0_g2~~TRINITY_DN53981_c0_g2_i1.p1  ORF type:complete len:409 (-),score=60.54 TRINITY_DN53981_c0_g2_i1:291-1517(-)
MSIIVHGIRRSRAFAGVACRSLATRFGRCGPANTAWRCGAVARGDDFQRSCSGAASFRHVHTASGATATTGKKTAAVTGAFSYTGRYLTRLLLDAGYDVVNLTNHPSRAWAKQTFSEEELSRIRSCPLDFDFDSKSELMSALEGVDVLFCTYWIRFEVDGDSHAKAADRLTVLFEKARDLGVRKVVFSSHTQATEDSPFSYIAGKAKAAAGLRRVCSNAGGSGGMAYAIVRPCGIFGDTPQESILMNNAAWVLRKVPLFVLAGDGSQRFQPVHVRDMAALMFELGISAATGEERDACGPEAPTATELFSHVAKACGTQAVVTPFPVGGGLSTGLVTSLTQPLNWYTGDVLLDKDDLDLLCSGLTTANDPDDPAIGQRRSLFSWLDEVGPSLGLEYINSMDRYYSKKPA